MNQSISFSVFSILFVLTFLLLATNIAAAELIEEANEIPYQVNHSDRIVIGTVSGIDIHYDHTIFTITVKEWLYNPLPTETIKVRTEIGTNFWTEDQAEFTQGESMLLMLKDENPNKQLFSVSGGFPGKHPVSDKDAVIEELKAQGKWQEEGQTGNKTNNNEVTENKGTAGKKEGNSNYTKKSNSIPFISPIWVLAALLGTVAYLRETK